MKENFETFNMHLRYPQTDEHSTNQIFFSKMQQNSPIKSMYMSNRRKINTDVKTKTSKNYSESRVKKYSLWK